MRGKRHVEIIPPMLGLATPVAPEMLPPRLYLDVDRVIIVEDSPFEMAVLGNSGEAYAPEVIRRLGNTCLDLVWLTTRENQALELADSLGGLRGGRVLMLANPEASAQIALPGGRVLKRNRHEASTQISLKMSALLGDQVRSPSPFVWVDDKITPTQRGIVSRYLSVPKLIIQPEGKAGINEAQLASIEAFARTHAA